MLTLSPDQQKVLDQILAWYQDPHKKQYLTLGGYAGTGKTTLISILRQQLALKHKDLQVSFCSYTGKATRVLRQKLQEQKAMKKQDNVSTIHSLIYSPIEENQLIVGWKIRPEIKTDLLILDEASMVDPLIFRDLLSFNTPILAVGDHGQLPPIKEGFNLMEKPHLKLEQIHRQAETNPIIALSIQARENGEVYAGHYGENVQKISRTELDSQETVNDWLNDYDHETLVLCGFNTTRIKLNHYLRTILGFEEPNPQSGDRVICLRNNRKQKIYNGMTGIIQEIESFDDDWYEALIQMDDENKPYEGLVLKKQFNSPQTLNFTEQRAMTLKGDLFDFGYALTVHKAQGSQAQKVILFEERSQHMDDNMWRRWLYTAITRAEEELYIVGK